MALNQQSNHARAGLHHSLQNINGVRTLQTDAQRGFKIPPKGFPEHFVLCCVTLLPRLGTAEGRHLHAARRELRSSTGAVPAPCCTSLLQGATCAELKHRVKKQNKVLLRSWTCRWAQPTRPCSCSRGVRGCLQLTHLCPGLLLPRWPQQGRAW